VTFQHRPEPTGVAVHDVVAEVAVWLLHTNGWDGMSMDEPAADKAAAALLRAFGIAPLDRDGYIVDVGAVDR